MYTRVESKFWQDEKMRSVSEDARFLMLYLLTSPHRNIIGFYFLPSPYACFDLGWDEKRFKKGLQELISNGLIKYDENVHVVLVKNFLKHNPLENPNQVKSAIEKLNELPETPLFQDFLTIVEGLGKQFTQPLKERLQERLQERFGKQGTGTGTGTEYNSTSFDKLTNVNLSQEDANGIQEDAIGVQQKVENENESDKPTNREIIAELTEKYREIEGIKPEKSDYAFIGNCYNEYGYTAVLEAIHTLEARITGGFKPDKPKIYLRGILKRNVQKKDTDIPDASNWRAYQPFDFSEMEEFT